MFASLYLLVVAKRKEWKDDDFSVSGSCQRDTGEQIGIN